MFAWRDVAKTELRLGYNPHVGRIVTENRGTRRSPLFDLAVTNGIGSSELSRDKRL